MMKKNSRVSCVIVNYNDAETTEKLVRKIYRYSVLEAIIVVDNCSLDNSRIRLQSLADELNPGEQKIRPQDMPTGKPGKIIVLSAKKNGGYGAGNNLGIRYAYQVLHTDYVLIANPDVEFSEQLVCRLLGLFERHPDIGAASACMDDPVYGKQRNGWPLFGFWHELARCGPVCRRIFSGALEYPETYFQGKTAVYVDAVHGSLLMVDAEKMVQCRGYDEGLFLYQEEAVLGWRMRELGWRSVLLLTNSYQHRHSTSISRTFQDAWERQKLRNKSCLYYYKQYLHINKRQELAAKLFFQIIHLEIWFCGKILKMRW